MQLFCEHCQRNRNPVRQLYRTAGNPPTVQSGMRDEKPSPFATGCTIAVVVALLLFSIPICLIAGVILAAELGWIYVP
jgi:hypothetical protein